MIFCSNCFCNSEVKAIIDRGGQLGTCPVCGASNVNLYDTQKDSTLSKMFDNFLSIYTAESDLPREFPLSECKTIVETVKEDWDVFSDIPDTEILNILKSLSPTILTDYPILFDEKVGIPEKYDEEYLKDNSILKSQKWGDFVESLKYKNRFHTNLINKDLLEKYCLDIAKSIPVGKQRYYRGRIADDNIGYTPKDMGAPPKKVATAGRANSAGISRLYLTDNQETTLHEIRAAEYDYVTIGTFKQLESIRVVDFKLIHKISPFGTEADCMAMAINRDCLLKINEEMSRTMRRNDSVLDYLPTQYISDFIMSISNEDGQPIYDGIEYQSAMHQTGSNLAIFYPEKFKCTYSRTYEVKKLHYSKVPLVKHKA